MHVIENSSAKSPLSHCAPSPQVYCSERPTCISASSWLLIALAVLVLLLKQIPSGHVARWVEYSQQKAVLCHHYPSIPDQPCLFKAFGASPFCHSCIHGKSTPQLNRTILLEGDLVSRFQPLAITGNTAVKNMATSRQLWTATGPGPGHLSEVTRSEDKSVLLKAADRFLPCRACGILQTGDEWKAASLTDLTFPSVS